MSDNPYRTLKVLLGKAEEEVDRQADHFDTLEEQLRELKGIDVEFNQLKKEFKKTSEELGTARRRAEFAEAQVRFQEEEMRKWYFADGTYELMPTVEAVVERRKKAARWLKDHGYIEAMAALDAYATSDRGAFIHEAARHFGVPKKAVGFEPARCTKCGVLFYHHDGWEFQDHTFNNIDYYVQHHYTEVEECYIIELTIYLIPKMYSAYRGVMTVITARQGAHIKVFLTEDEVYRARRDFEGRRLVRVAVR